MKKNNSFKILMTALLLCLCFAFAACNGGTTTPPKEPDNPDNPNVPDPVVYSIDEEFENSIVDTTNWDLGDVKNMHEVKDGKLILTHTGVTDYPSKGRNMKVTLDKYPYVAVKIDALEGPSPMWGIKLLTSADANPSREVQADTNQTGVLFYDLRKISGLPATGDASFAMYIYILGGQGNSVSVDYIKSMEKIPTKQNFDEKGAITVEGGSAEFKDGQMTVSSNAPDSECTVSLPVYNDSDVTNMMDLFVSSVGENAGWSLEQGEKTIFAFSEKYGAFSYDCKNGNLPKGEQTLKLKVKGTVSFDQLRFAHYKPFSESFNYADDDALTSAWKDSGSAYVEKNDKGMLIQKVYGVTGAARVSGKANTNVSAYPKLSVKVEAMSANTAIKVSFAGQSVLENITEAGEYTCDLTSKFLSDIGAYSVTFELSSTAEQTEEMTVNAVIGKIELLADAQMSMNALPPKGVKTEREGCLIEQGNNADNFVGDAKVVARGGKLLVVQNSVAGYSKGQVFARNVNLLVNRFLNVKIDAVDAGTQYKINVIYNPDLAGEFTAEVLLPTSDAGTYTVDLYKALNLNDSNKVAERISYDIFVIGGMGKTVTVGFLNNTDEIAVEPEIVNVQPDASKTIVVGTEVALSAELKFHSGTVKYIVKNEAQEDVTLSVVKDGKFVTETKGIYYVIFSFEGAENVVRTITVEQAGTPTISVTTPAVNNIKVGESLALNYTLENITEGSDAVITAVDGDNVDVTSKVISAKKFCSADTGVYTIKFNYEGAAEQSITVNVTSLWSTSEAITISEKDGKTIFATSGDWPKASRTFKNVCINDTPYLKLVIDEATSSAFKLQAYDITFIDETSGKGTLYVDMRVKGPFAGNPAKWVKEDIPMEIYVVAYGSAKQVVISQFTFVSASELPPEIVEVTPSTDKIITAGESLSISAKIKDNSSSKVGITVQKDGIDVTESTLSEGVFTSSETGVYKVTFSYSGASDIVRNITVVAANVPVISLTVTDKTVKTDESMSLTYSISHAAAGEKATITVLLNATDVTTKVLSGESFSAAETGVYTVKFNYTGASEQSISITVVSRWTTSEDLTITEKDGAVTFSTSGDYPKALQTYENVCIANTPYIKVVIDEASTAEFKLVAYGADFISQTGVKGVFYVDMRTTGIFASTPEKWENGENIPMELYVVANGEKFLTVLSFEFISEAQHDAEQNA